MLDTIISIHINYKLSRIVVVGTREGPWIYKITFDNKYEKEGHVLTRREIRKTNQNVFFDVKWSYHSNKNKAQASQFLIFCSGNKTISLWNTELKKVVKNFRMSSEAHKLWWDWYDPESEHFLSGNDNGYIYYWNRTEDAPLLAFYFKMQNSSVNNISMNPYHNYNAQYYAPGSKFKVF